VPSFELASTEDPTTPESRVNTQAIRMCHTLITPLAIFVATAGLGCNDPVRPGEGRLRERWFEHQTSGFPKAAPLVNGSTVYFASGTGSVIARDIETGAARWYASIGQSEYSVSAEISGENFILGKGVLVAAVQFHTSGLDTATGREIWRYHAPLDTIDDRAPRPGYVAEARIAADDNAVFIPAWGATVSAVDLRTGQAKWVWRVEPTLANRSGASGVAISGDTIFATVWHFLNQTGTHSEAWLVALNKQTGAELWRVLFPHQASGTMIACAPAVAGNLVIVTLVSGDIYAVNRNTQTIAWEIQPQIAANGVGSALISSPEVYDGIVYANGSDAKVHAYRVKDGTEIWASFTDQLYTDPAVSAKFVYASNGASLYILDRLTGAQYTAVGHPRKSVDYVFSSPPTVVNGKVFITISDGAWSFDEP
jgi:outer membrane protein assembly factor BamB